MSFASIIDGTSNTAGLQRDGQGRRRRHRDQHQRGRGVRPPQAVGLDDAVGTFAGNPRADYTACLNAGAPKAANSRATGRSASTGTAPSGATGTTTTRCPPTPGAASRPRPRAGPVGNLNYGAFTASSRHPGDVNDAVLRRLGQGDQEHHQRRRPGGPSAPGPTTKSSAPTPIDRSIVLVPTAGPDGRPSAIGRPNAPVNRGRWRAPRPSTSPTTRTGTGRRPGSGSTPTSSVRRSGMPADRRRASVSRWGWPNSLSAPRLATARDGRVRSSQARSVPFRLPWCASFRTPTPAQGSGQWSGPPVPLSALRVAGQERRGRPEVDPNPDAVVVLLLVILRGLREDRQRDRPELDPPRPRARPGSR